MEGFYAMRKELREAFYPLIRNSATEEKFIEYIRISIEKSNKFDIRALEVVLDLSLVVLSRSGDIPPSEPEESAQELDNFSTGQDDSQLQGHPYDGDDEDLDELFIFPCHLNFDECHPESLHNYHSDHMKNSKTTILLIKCPKICNFVIEYMFSSLKLQIETLKSFGGEKEANCYADDGNQIVTHDSLNNYLNSAAILIKRINKVCNIERRNCRVLSRVNLLTTIMNNIIYLVEEIPEKQHIYLQAMLDFAFSLADYKINGSNLRQLFCIIKNENADLKTVLTSFEKLLNYQFAICKNIQPMKSLNFPTASRTPEEIRSDLYILNSWHWRLRSKVIDYKRNRSRSSKQEAAMMMMMKERRALASSPESCDTSATIPLEEPPPAPLESKPEPSSFDRVTSSWLECSMIAPLSNISPLTQTGELKFCCSLWMSVCGDLLVIDEREALCRSRTNGEMQADHQQAYIAPNWRNRNGFWLRLISRRRLMRRFAKDKRYNSASSGKSSRRKRRRLSEKLRERLLNERQEEEEEEASQRIKKSELELEQLHATAFGLRRNFSFSSNNQSFKRSPSIARHPRKQQVAENKSNKELKESKLPPEELLSKRPVESDQKLLMHVISFAMDTLTIEVWLNVKRMLFCVRACRVAREGSTMVIDQIELPSHLEANGNWAHILFSLHELNKPPSHINKDKLVHLRLLVDGLHEEEGKLSYGAHKSPLTNFALLLGCERSTFGYVWKLSQVNIYKSVPCEDIPVFLLGKGPDFRNFTNFTNQQATLPLPDISQRSIKKLLNPKLLRIYSNIDEGMCLNWLTQNVVLAYVAHQADYFLDYSSSLLASSLGGPEASDLSNSAERFIQARILNFTRSLKFNTNEGFGSALVGAGGIESVLVCFTDVIRRAQETSNIHHLAFSILLKMSQTNQHQLNKFIDELNGLKLVEFMLVHPDCIISEQMLDYYLEFCLMRENGVSLIKSAKLIYHLLTCWRAWHKNTSVARKLYRELATLLEPAQQVFLANSPITHSQHKDYINHNFNMLTSAGTIDLLINILRESLDDSTAKIDHQIIELIANLIAALIKPTPGLDVMLDIMEFLLFLHPDVKSYVDGALSKSSFLRELSLAGAQNEAVYDETDEARTPSSESYSSASLDEFRDHSKLYGPGSSLSSSSDEQLHEADNLKNLNSLHNLSSFIEHCGLEAAGSEPLSGTDRILWPSDQNKDEKPELSEQSSKVLGCTYRDYAIAKIVDILANIVVKLTSTDPSKILSEALQKPIIDARKLIVLANSDSALVREKVLRLFLRCIKASYSLNLKSVLAKYEQETKGSAFKICIPMQLMACQLLKYPTSSKMVQLCYGIIVGIDESEVLKPDCFNVDSIDNSLQLNTLILLIQLTSRLDKAPDISYWLQFIYSYLKRLIQLQAQNDILAQLIKNNLVECLMKLYFAYIETELQRANADEGRNTHKVQQELLKSLDKTLILVASYFIKYQPVSEAVHSINDLLTYLNVMNTYVTSKRFQKILRDRQVKVLSTSMGYCKHYEKCARLRKYDGKLDYHVKNFLKTAYLDTSPTLLSSSELQLNNFLFEEQNYAADGSEQLSSSPLSRFANKYSEEELDKIPESDNISEIDVKEFYKASLDFVVDFIRIRDTDIITSPLEKHFIIQVVNLLMGYLSEFQCWRNSRKTIESHWTILLRDLQETIRESFYDLLLYLLSPCKSMNIDERKYYASEILKIFGDQEAAFELLDNENNCKILVHFIKDLISQSEISIQKEDYEQTIDDVLENDTENKLKNLAKSIEAQLKPQTNGNGHQNGHENHYRSLLSRRTQNGNSRLPCDIMASKWILQLEQKRDLSLQNIEILKENRILSIVRNNPTDNLPDISSRLLDEAYNITREVGDDRNEQRKAYFEDLKQNKVYNYHTRQQWLSLIIGHTHERATWYMGAHYPASWELNPVEGPSRIRRRLRPCKLMLDSRFLRHPTQALRPNESSSDSRRRRRRRTYSPAKEEASNLSETPESTSLTKNNMMKELETMLDDWCNLYSPHPLCSMIINHGQSMSSNELRTRKFTADKIPFNCDCSIIRANEVCDGELLIASWCIHFIGERTDTCQELNERLIMETNKQGQESLGGDEKHCDSAAGSRSKNIQLKRELERQIVVEDLWFDEIVEVWDRRYQLQDLALEIFLTNNMTYLISFKSNRQRENFKQSLMREQHKMINLQRFNLNSSLNRVTQLWREGKLTNFDYLTCLNKLAGRSFNDLMQYPIFPFVLSNYTSSVLDLSLASNYRKLSRPMAIQSPDKEQIYLRNYEDSKWNNLSPIEFPGISNEPYHYGNHYSNSATVLHFLVRLPPFTQMLIQYQDNNFDQPDRTFHSIANLWQLITKDSNTDFKELIPEFFFLPEMFLNFEQLNLGTKQNNEIVDDVKLPPWCPNADARLFTLIHRQALESAYVSENIHHWIDLIFGYKQTGKAAVESLNVFHPATYYGMIDLNGEQQELSRNSSTPIKSVIANLSSTGGKSSSVSLPNNHSSLNELHSSSGADNSKQPPRAELQPRQQAKLERNALETMIKTYGQMPRQLFRQPLKQRSSSLFAFERNKQVVVDAQENGEVISKIPEPLRQVRSLRWGSYVGSPSENEIIAVKHRKIISDELLAQNKRNRLKKRHQQNNSNKFDPYSSRNQTRFSLCLLANGEMAVLRNNTSLMLDYKGDRKSAGSFQFSVPSARLSRRAGLSSVGRMNLFSNMIISRQQFSYMDITGHVQSEAGSLPGSSLVSLSSSKAKFSHDSLSLVSWSYLDGTIRIRNPASNTQKSSVPLVQADSSVDTMSTCASVPELNLLLIGYESGSICAHIVSSSHETVPVLQQAGQSSPGLLFPPNDSSLLNLKATSSKDRISNGPAANAQNPSSSQPGPKSLLNSTNNLNEPGNPPNELHMPMSLIGKTLQSVKTFKKTTRWLSCHSKKVNCMKINVSFGIVVTCSDDGTAVIWDLNSLTYVRSIDYKLKSSIPRRRLARGVELRRQAHSEERSSSSNADHQDILNNKYQQQLLLDYLCNCDPPDDSNLQTNSSDERTQKKAATTTTNNQFNHSKATTNKQCCYICGSGINLIAISDTLGDIVTVKDISNRLAMASESEPSADDHQNGDHNEHDDDDGDETSSSANMSTTSNNQSSEQSDSDNSLTSVIYAHTINGALIGFVSVHTQVTAVCYSNAPEGISVNVIVVGLADGLIRLYSSWDLSRVKEFHVAGISLPITSLLYSRDNQLLYITYEDGQLVVLCNKRKSSVPLLKELYL